LNCPRCKGSGKCVECEGAGYIECPSCSGKGKKKTSRGVNYSCKACGGNGKMDCSLDCSSCNGTGEITEEFQKETREKYTPKFVNYTPSSAVVRSLIIFNIVVFALVEWGPSDIANSLLLSSESLGQGHYWAFLTPAFLHGSAFHLLLNMLFLGAYGPPLEGLLGKRRFLATYLFTAITGCLLSYLGNIELRGQFFAGVGASGALFGMVGSYIALQYRWRIVTTINLRSLINWTGLLLLVGFSLEWTEYNYIDNWGHLGGLLGGLALNYVLPKPKGR
jgi:membrane associated rhomboid family serine protease